MLKPSLKLREGVTGLRWGAYTGDVITYGSGERLARLNVNVAAPYCLSHPRVLAKNRLHEAFVLIDRETEGSLASVSYTRTHRLHYGHTTSRTSSAP
jgi:hypothetical protein